MTPPFFFVAQRSYTSPRAPCLTSHPSPPPPFFLHTRGDTATLYLDDEVSGYIMTNNYFEDVSRVLELGGGRDNVFSGNVINGTTSNPAITFDNRGEGWAHGECTPPNGELIKFLARVPYTGPLWAAAFPSLANILNDDPCTPKHNSIVNNFYCNLAHGFIDKDNATITSWDSTMYGNIPSCPSKA